MLFEKYVFSIGITFSQLSLTEFFFTTEKSQMTNFDTNNVDYLTSLYQHDRSKLWPSKAVEVVLATPKFK